MTTTELNKLEKKTLKRLETISISHNNYSDSQISACAEILSHITQIRYARAEQDAVIDG